MDGERTSRRREEKKKDIPQLGSGGRVGNFRGFDVHQGNFQPGIDEVVEGFDVWSKQLS